MTIERGSLVDRLLHDKFLNLRDDIGYILSGSYLTREEYRCRDGLPNYSDIDILRISSSHAPRVSTVPFVNAAVKVSVRDFEIADVPKIPAWLYNIWLGAVKTNSSPSKLLSPYRALLYKSLFPDDLDSAVGTAWVYCLNALANVGEASISYPLSKLLLVLIKIYAQSREFFAFSYKANVSRLNDMRLIDGEVAQTAYLCKTGKLWCVGENMLGRILDECVRISRLLWLESNEYTLVSLREFISKCYIYSSWADDITMNRVVSFILCRLEDLPYFEKGREGVYTLTIEKLGRTSAKREYR